MCRGQIGAFVFEGVDGAIGSIGKPPRAAEINHTQAARERLRHPFARLLVRRGKKENLNAAVCEQLPGKGLLL